MSEKLKPCPFCDGTPEIHVCDASGAYHSKVGTVFYGRQLTHKMIVCGKCGIKTKAYLTDRGLFKAWNRRAENA